MTIYDVKNYLRVDTDDDDTLINTLMEAADSYLQGAVDNYTETYDKAGIKWQSKADLAKKLLIADWYEHREAVERPVSPSIRLLLTQLQLEGVKNG
jgi:uncharacterized phage protein (predicted DNA packaging)